MNSSFQGAATGLRKCILLACTVFCFQQGFSQQKKDTVHNMIKSRDEMKAMKAGTPLDTPLIEKIVGKSGSFNKGAYKITIPQNDLNVQVDGFKIIPAMGLGSWICFAPSRGGAMIMGDLVLTGTDLKPVQQEIIRQGLTITAIHNHFVRSNPGILYMHIGGSGSVEQLAKKVRAVLDMVNQARGGDPSKGAVSNGPVENTIDIKELDKILGRTGDTSKGVYKYVFDRPDVSLKEHGVPVTGFMGFNTWAAFQGSPDNAAVAGDFAMLENEVAPVIKTLVENGIEVVAVHNHMVHEQPKIFFLHYWGVGNAEQLAKALKAALNQTGKKAGSMHSMGMVSIALTGKS